jgi:EAL domain-containing protein (putative c-di-GMP-specific phosphodiesterase class I)/GGDEF domain-containing protein
VNALPAVELSPSQDVARLGYDDLVDLIQRTLESGCTAMALVVVDVAEVSKLQARIGFDAAEQILDAIAGRFTSVIADRGTACRFGDGRYCVLVRDVRNKGHAQLAAEKLLRVADEALAANAVSIRPAMPTGIALWPSQAESAVQLLRHAQLAATTARYKGERIRVFDADAATQILKPWELGDAYAKALETSSLSVFYQPKIRIADRQVAGTEALLRWIENGKPVATPDVFIPLAEEAGSMHDTTWYVLSNALRDSAALGSLPVAVNISPAMLHEREFIEMVRSAVDNWHVPEGHLTLEVTEGAVIADFELSAKRLAKVRDLGVRIALDDFGTGYSSLAYFKKLPADELKIDKAFVLRMQQDKEDQHMVDTIVRLAHHFGLKVVAEGVEDEVALGMLHELGCDYAQGFYFSKALDVGSLRAWLNEYAAKQSQSPQG